MAGFTREQKKELVEIVKPLFDDLALQIGQKFEEIEERFCRIEDRLDRIEARLERIEFRLDRMERRLDEAEDVIVHHRLGPAKT